MPQFLIDPILYLGSQEVISVASIKLHWISISSYPLNRNSPYTDWGVLGSGELKASLLLFVPT